jgi:hypothetical protein
MRRFAYTLNLKPEDRVVDIGGTPLIWSYLMCRPREIDIVNIYPALEVPPGFRYIQADARSLQPNTYDVVFSNSVIEHVGGFKEQQEFAQACRNAGRKLWVQTPAKCFPIEPHYLGLFVHWLPMSWRPWFAQWFTLRGWMSKPEEIWAMVKEIRLLSRREMRQLFPDCKIVTERFLWVYPKAYIAVRAPE